MNFAGIDWDYPRYGGISAFDKRSARAWDEAMAKHDEVLAQFRADLKTFQDSMAFWQTQPPIEVGAGVVHEPRAAQIEMLKAALIQTETAIRVLEADDA